MRKEIIVLTATGAIVAVGFAAAGIVKLFKLCKKLGLSIKEIEKKTPIEVSDDVIEEVVRDTAQKTLERNVSASVSKVTREIKDQANKSIHDEIKVKVDAASPDIAAELRRQLDSVDIANVKRMVIEEAINRAKKEILSDLKDAEKNAKREISDAADDAKKRMQDEIEDQVRDCVGELREAADDKFETELESLTQRYKGRLDDVSDIYASFANKIMK